MKSLALILTLLTSPAFAKSVSIPLFKCAKIQQFNTETGAEYTSQTSKTVLVHDACAKKVEQQGFITSVEFNGMDATTLVLKIHAVSGDGGEIDRHAHFGDNVDGTFSIQYASVQEARSAKAKIEASNVGMAVLNPKAATNSEYNTDSYGETDSTNIDINLYDSVNLSQGDLFLVHTPKTAQPSGMFARLINAIREKF